MRNFCLAFAIDLLLLDHPSINCEIFQVYIISSIRDFIYPVQLFARFCNLSVRLTEKVGLTKL